VTGAVHQVGGVESQEGGMPTGSVQPIGGVQPGGIEGIGGGAGGVQLGGGGDSFGGVVVTEGGDAAWAFFGQKMYVTRPPMTAIPAHVTFEILERSMIIPLFVRSGLGLVVVMMTMVAGVLAAFIVASEPVVTWIRRPHHQWRAGRAVRFAVVIADVVVRESGDDGQYGRWTWAWPDTRSLVAERQDVRTGTSVSMSTLHRLPSLKETRIAKHVEAVATVTTAVI